jgi:hypothetical protein
VDDDALDVAHLLAPRRTAEGPAFMRVDAVVLVVGPYICRWQVVRIGQLGGGYRLVMMVRRISLQRVDRLRNAGIHEVQDSIQQLAWHSYDVLGAT